MPRKPTTSAIVCQYFSWRLFNRDGVFYADGRGGKYDLGKHSLATRDREEALSRLRLLDKQLAVKLGLADGMSAPVVGDISIIDGWKMFLEFCGRSAVLGGVSSDSLQRYKAVRDKHVKFCSRHGLTTWAIYDVQALEKYGNWRSKHSAYRTTYFDLTLIKSVNNWLIANKHISAECKLHYSLRKPQGTDTHCYSMAEVLAMITHCQADPNLKWLADVIIALAHLGVRISELAGLRWADVDLVQRFVRVADERSSRRKQLAGSARTSKGRRSRTIPIHPVLLKLLLNLERKPDGYIFHAQRGGRLLPRNVLQMFIDEVIEPLKGKFPTSKGDIGFEHGRLHSFRHYFCSQCFLGGASEGEIKKWLGHADSKMVEHYRHLRNEDAQRKMSQIDFLGPQDQRPGDMAS